ncbi:MAG: PAS domain S-box protein [Desulfuromonadales bacterium]
MSIPFPKSIRSQLFIIALIVAFPAVCVIFYSGFQSRNDAISEARRDTLKLAEIIATEQQHLVIGAEQLMTALAQLPDVRKRDTARVEPVLKKLRALNPMFSNIFIADLDGLVWATAVPATPPFVISDRRYFKNAVASGQLSSGEYVVSRATTKPAFNLAYPVKDDQGTIIGVISVGFIIDKYRQLVERQHVPEGTSFVLVDHRGIILSRAIEPERYIGKPYTPDSFRKMLEEPDTSTTIRTGIAGDRRIISLRKLYLPGEKNPYMFITAGVPVDVALRDANRLLLKSVTFFMLFLGAALLLAWYFGKRSISDRIRVLENASQRLADGDLHVKVSSLISGGELGRLADSFDIMVRKLAESDKVRQDKEFMLREQNNQLEMEMGERQKAQEQLREKERFLQTIIDTEPECVKMLDIEGNLLLMNRSGLMMIDAESFDQVKGQNVCPLVVQEYRDAFLQLTVNAFAGKSGMLRFEVVGLKGRHVWLESHVVPYRDQSGDVVASLSITRDITGQKHAAEEQQKTAFILENLADAVYWTDMKGKFLYVNKAACIMRGYSREELLSMRVADTDPNYPVEAWEAHMEELKRDGSRHFETIHQAKDGRFIPVDMAVYHFNYEGVEYNCAIARDITRHRSDAEEREKLEKQLIQLQKIESVGRLAGGIAHDFNNLLTPILGYSELLKRNIPADSADSEKINSIIQAADKARILTRQLLSFGRKQILEMKTVDMNDVITSFYQILRRTIRENIDIRLHLTEDRRGIRADMNQLEQMIMNLAVNAQDAIAGNGIITIETEYVTLDDEYVRQHAGVTAGNYLMLAVTDTGSGMDQQTLANIFEPFFTTKGIGKGSGLGLATVYGLLKQHGGNVWVYSEIDKGTVFKLYFPLVDEKPDVCMETVSEQPVIQADGRVILLVEDNNMVRELAHDALLGYGFTVLAEEGPLQAIKISEGRHIDLLVSDVIMPDMNGPALHKCLLETHPGLQVIYMSGYTNNVIAHHGVLDKGINFIQKPFTINDLARKVEAVLNPP